MADNNYLHGEPFNMYFLNIDQNIAPASKIEGSLGSGLLIGREKLSYNLYFVDKTSHIFPLSDTSYLYSTDNIISVNKSDDDLETKFKLLYDETYFNDNEGLNLNINQIKSDIENTEYIRSLQTNYDKLLQKNQQLEDKITKLQEQYNDLYSVITLLDITKIEYIRKDYDVNVYYKGNIFELNSYKSPDNIISTSLGDVKLHIYNSNKIHYIDYKKIDDLGIEYYTQDITNINPVKLITSDNINHLDYKYKIEIDDCYIDKSNLFNESGEFNMNMINYPKDELTPDVLNQNKQEKNISNFIAANYNYNDINGGGIFDGGKALTAYMNTSYELNSNSTYYNYTFEINNNEFYSSDRDTFERINLGLYYNYADISYTTNMDLRTISYYKYNCRYGGDLILYSPYDYGIGHNKSNSGLTIKSNHHPINNSIYLYSTSYLAYIIKYDFWDDRNCYNVGILQATYTGIGDVQKIDLCRKSYVNKNASDSNSKTYIRYKSIDLLPITLYEKNDYIINNYLNDDCITHLDEIYSDVSYYFNKKYKESDINTLIDCLYVIDYESYDYDIKLNKLNTIYDMNRFSSLSKFNNFNISSKFSNNENSLNLWEVGLNQEVSRLKFDIGDIQHKYSYNMSEKLHINIYPIEQHPIQFIDIDKIDYVDNKIEITDKTKMYHGISFNII